MVRYNLFYKNCKKIQVNLDYLILLKCSALSMFSQIAGKGISFLTNFVFARVLGASLLGDYYLGTTLLTITSKVTALGLPKGTLRYVTEFRMRGEKENLCSLIYTSIFLGLISSTVIMVIIFLLKNEIAELFPKANINLIFKYLLWLLPVSVISSIIMEILRGFRQFTIIILGQSFLWSVFILGSFLIMLFFLQNKVDVRYAFLAYITGTILIFLIYLIVLEKKVLNNGHVKTYYDKNVAKNLILTSLPLFIVSGSNMFLTWTDTVMLGSLLGSKDVGIYGAASRVAVIISFALGAVNSVIQTLIGENYHAGNQEKLQRMLRTVCSWLVYIDLPLFLIFLSFPKEIMGIFGAEFKTGYMVLVVLSICQFINVFFGPVGYLLMMSGYERVVSGITVFCGMLNVFGNWFLIPKIGVIGAAISTGGSLVMQNILMVIAVLIKTRIKVIPKGPWFIGAIVIVMIAISFMLYNYNLITRIAGVGIELLIVSISILKYLIDDTDKRFLVNILKQVGII